MKITRNKLIILAAIAVVLTVSFFLGGKQSAFAPDSSQKHGTEFKTNSGAKNDVDSDTALQLVKENKDISSGKSPEMNLTPPKEQSKLSSTEKQPQSETKKQTDAKPNEKPVIPDQSAGIVSVQTADQTTDQTNAVSASATDSGSQTLTPKTVKDKYMTESVPIGKPIPVDPQTTVISDKAYTCTLSVDCTTILKNLSKLNPEKKELVPSDGVIYAKRQVTFYEGESVFNVLLREMKKNKIHLEFVNTPIYNSAYIEGIHNLYEFDCGELSGWVYKVNGWSVNYGCSRYQLKDGDVVEWVYTCDLGRDIGDESVDGGQRE